MSSGLRFITKNGHKIPLRVATGVTHGARIAKHAVRGAVAGYGGALIAKHGLKEPASSPVKVDKRFALASLGTAVASGVIGALTFTGGLKKIAAGALGVHIVDAAGIGLNAASLSGGAKKDKAKVLAKQEAVNFAVGNAVFAAGLIGIKSNRQAAVKYASEAVNFARKALRVI